MVNPFLTPVGGSRRQFTLPQNQFTQQNQYDFSGWGDRLGKIEEGIASLTDQFKNFQTPGDVAPEYVGDPAPNPLDPTLPGIDEPMPIPIDVPGQPTPPGKQEPIGGTDSYSQKWKDYWAPGGGGSPDIDPTTGMPIMGTGVFQGTSLYDWTKGYDFDLQPGQDNPEYQAWQQRQEARGPLSEATQEAMYGPNDISSYIREKGGAFKGYDQYLAEIERQKQNYGQPTGLSWMKSLPGGGSTTGVDINKNPLGAADYQTLSEEEYGRQSDVWAKHLDFKKFAGSARHSLGLAEWGTDDTDFATTPGLGHAYEAWQQFNQGQEGGPWMRRPEYGEPGYWGPMPMGGGAPLMSTGITANSSVGVPIGNQLQQGLGALQGPTQMSTGITANSSVGVPIGNQLQRGAGGEPLSSYHMFQGPEGEERLAGLFPIQQVQQQGGPQYSNLLNLSPDQQQYAQKQRLEYKQGAGLGALQGPTQKKIQQGIGALV